MRSVDPYQPFASRYGDAAVIAAIVAWANGGGGGILNRTEFARLVAADRVATVERSRNLSPAAH